MSIVPETQVEQQPTVEDQLKEQFDDVIKDIFDEEDAALKAAGGEEKQEPKAAPEADPKEQPKEQEAKEDPKDQAKEEPKEQAKEQPGQEEVADDADLKVVEDILDEIEKDEAEGKSGQQSADQPVESADDKAQADDEVLDPAPEQPADDKAKVDDKKLNPTPDESAQPDDKEVNPVPEEQAAETDDLLDKILKEHGQDDQEDKDPTLEDSPDQPANPISNENAATNQDNDDADQIDSSSKINEDSKYTKQQMIEALGDHVEEIKAILEDIEEENAQRAAFDLLFGEDYEGEWSEICKDEISTNFSQFCTDKPTPTHADVKQLLIDKLKQRLQATEEVIRSGHINRQFEQLAIDVINERDEFNRSEHPQQVNPATPVIPSVVQSDEQPLSLDNSNNSAEMGSSWLLFLIGLAAAYFLFKRYQNVDRIPKQGSLLL